MNNAVEIGEKGVTVHLAGGGRVVLGAWGYDTSTAANPQPPLTPDEEKYGRGLCLLPTGWEELSAGEHWQTHLSDPLRQLWPSFNREQKMAIAYTISELSDELTNIAYEHSW
ncbi:hypothetical protein ABRV10_002761 [Citrobacter amalonaticus]|uniref:Uncharacterized protein n=1 Tax=Citrobacter amalonaticus TaxID=35703 RepID=A0A9C7QR87_CITAM|nr:hypothetical protein [Citrobacter sp.]HCD1258019.1 hypothetical protein [Citrobacter amalonaticus]